MGDLLSQRKTRNISILDRLEVRLQDEILKIERSNRFWLNAGVLKIVVVNKFVP